jgi:hypothetical protein
MENQVLRMPILDSNSTTGTFKLSAKPSLISDGQFKGELQGVEFIASSTTETMHWHAINCGQFEQAFSKLIPQQLATETVETLARGEDIEFPGSYRREQFDGGFHYEWSPVFSHSPSSLLYACLLEPEVQL